MTQYYPVHQSDLLEDIPSVVSTHSSVHSFSMEEGEEVVVVYEYTAALPDELSLKVGDVITRVERIEGGWWRGELNKVRGMFPDNFVKVSFMNYIRLLCLLAL